MTGTDAALTAVVSYAHSDPGWTAEQAERRREDVLRLVAGLREHGIDADADAFHVNEDWTRWGPRMVIERDVVLIVASQAWRAAWLGSGDELKNRGLRAEADAVHSIEARGRSEFQRRCRVIMLPGSSEADIPAGMEGLARHRIDGFDSASLERLLRDLTNQPPHLLPALGPVPHLPPASLASTERAEPGERAGHAGRVVAGDLWRAAPPIELARSDASYHRFNDLTPKVVVHLVPVPQAPFSQRQLSGIEEAAVRAMRDLLTPHAELASSASGDTVTVETALVRAGSREVTMGQVLGCRLARSGQVSVWFSLARDSMGAVLDEGELTKDLTSALRIGANMLSQLGVGREQRVAVAAELAETMLLTDGALADLGRRNSASMHGAMGRPVTLAPDESVPLDALNSADLDRVAATVADVLLGEWRR